MSSTKLIVLKSKELIYTAILLALIIVFVIIMINMFKDKDDTKNSDSSVQTSAQTASSDKVSEIRYTPGTYTSPLVLGDNTLSVMVTVDENYITPSGDNTYTTRLIVDSIRNALADAVVN